jgi:aminobenzoyl-glutamate utilization protein B
VKKIAWAWIDENKEYLISLSDKIWSFAELGLVEYKSSKLLSDELERHGFKVERGVAEMPTAFIGTWGNGRPIIGIMGEYDALPGLSQKPVTRKDPVSEGAPGHGCGHNIHGVSGLAGAISLKQALERTGLDGTVKFFGTPAEENYDGKVFMVREGYFNDIDVCLSHHPGQVNTPGLRSSNAMNSVKFHFYGKSSHAASSPEQGNSALDAVELMNIGVNYLREHVIEKTRIHYIIEDGGNQPNVVPDYARVWYYIRAPERSQVEHIYERILKIAEGATLMTNTTQKVEFLTGISNIIPNRKLSKIIEKNMREVKAPQYNKDEIEFAKKISETITKQEKENRLITENIPNWEKYVDTDIMDEIIESWDEGMVMAGSTDVADVSWITPTIEFRTATFILGIPGHSWQAVACSGTSIAHKSLIFAAKTLAGAAIDLICEQELIQEVKAEFNRRMMNKKYKPPIPKDVKPPIEVAKEAATKFSM